MAWDWIVHFPWLSRLGRDLHEVLLTHSHILSVPVGKVTLGLGKSPEHLRPHPSAPVRFPRQGTGQDLVPLGHQHAGVLRKWHVPCRSPMRSISATALIALRGVVSRDHAAGRTAASLARAMPWYWTPFGPGLNSGDRHRYKRNAARLAFRARSRLRSVP